MSRVYTHMTHSDPTTFLPLTDLAFNVVVALSGEPMHGYALIKELRGRTGRAGLRSGTVYAALARLTDDGLVEDLLRVLGGGDEGVGVAADDAAEPLEEVGAHDQAGAAVGDARSRSEARGVRRGGGGAEVRETTLTQPNLEALFIKLTGKELRE